MDNSSNESEKLLEKITLKQLMTCISLLRKHKYTQQEFIQQRYHEHALHFAQTLEFLIVIGWVEHKDNRFILTHGITDFTESSIVKDVIESLMTKPNDFQPSIATYVRKYIAIGDTLIHKPMGERRIEYSAIRNLLMDWKVISHATDNDLYLFNPAHINLYLWARNYNTPSSTRSLEANNKKKAALGAAAD